jgi:hypothetical protein
MRHLDRGAPPLEQASQRREKLYALGGGGGRRGERAEPAELRWHRAAGRRVAERGGRRGAARRARPRRAAALAVHDLA